MIGLVAWGDVILIRSRVRFPGIVGFSSLGLGLSVASDSVFFHGTMTAESSREVFMSKHQDGYPCLCGGWGQL